MTIVMKVGASSNPTEAAEKITWPLGYKVYKILNWSKKVANVVSDEHHQRISHVCRVYSFSRQP